jgi:hypothetical protein
MKPSTLPFKMVILVQVTSGISGDVCLQTLTDIQSWVGDTGLIMVHEKYFFTNHISTFLWFLFNVVFLTTYFPSRLNLSIVQTSLLPY